YGNTKISVAQLNNDFTQKSTTQVYSSSITIEGSHMKKINNRYYIFVTQPASNEYVLKSNSGPLGPYEFKIFTKAPASGIQGSGNPHQGSVVDTPNGDWYYLSFIDAYPGGRSPALAPFVFDSQGWPSLKATNGFAIENPYPVIPVPVKSATGTDTFSSGKLGPRWEWNHNPDTSKFSFAAGGGLVLKTASVTKDLYHAKNTLTHRILGPDSTATIQLDISQMTSTDQAGLSLFRDNSAYIGIRNGVVILQRDITMGAAWNTLSTGRLETSASLPAKTTNVWLRLHADIKPAGTHQGVFSYSTDGKSFKQLGTPYTMNTTYYFFIGYRFGIFNFAEQGLGGSVVVKSFDLALGAK
ncbi:Arabinanase/levansucrase/invertase, partial [Aureobasidium pullulans]